MNFYLIEEHQDPGQELEWLEGLLKEMEAAGETGILIGHVPTGETCLFEWAARFNGLLERYQHILRTQLYGHVHLEKYSTARASVSKKPISNQFWASSGTPFVGHNPAFRVVEIDQETMLPINLETYIFDLSVQEPKWAFSHDYLEYYKLDDLSPKSMMDLADRFKADEDLSLVYLNT